MQPLIERTLDGGIDTSTPLETYRCFTCDKFGNNLHVTPQQRVSILITYWLLIQNSRQPADGADASQGTVWDDLAATVSGGL